MNVELISSYYENHWFVPVSQLQDKKHKRTWERRDILELSGIRKGLALKKCWGFDKQRKKSLFYLMHDMSNSAAWTNESPETGVKKQTPESWSRSDFFVSEVNKNQKASLRKKLCVRFPQKSPQEDCEKNQLRRRLIREGDNKKQRPTKGPISMNKVLAWNNQHSLKGK